MTAAPYSVAALTALIRDAVAARPELEDVLVEGEISNISFPASGHVYFTLKDPHAALSCVAFRTNASRIPFRPGNGMTVIAHGHVDIFDQQGRYQLYVDRLEPSGTGALALAVEQLKRKLSEAGLFDDRLKRGLPLLPRRVAVVTSRSGAALRDVVTVVGRRAPCVDVILSPATVQGDGAVDTLVTALRRADGVRGADVILLVRGGGSIEDLMPFNSEALARAIRATRLPVVSGIGHETDTTVADLAADRRAATPSAAAELVVPSVVALRQDLTARGLRLGNAVSRDIDVKRAATDRSAARLARLSPAHRVATMRQDVDLHAALLRHALLSGVHRKRRRLDDATARLRLQSPTQRLALARAELRHASDRIRVSMLATVRSSAAGLDARRARLEALSPQRTLQRGYSITVDDASGSVVMSVSAVRPGSRLRTLVSDGHVRSDVVDVDPRSERGDDTASEQMYDGNPTHDD